MDPPRSCLQNEVPMFLITALSCEFLLLKKYECFIFIHVLGPFYQNNVVSVEYGGNGSERKPNSSPQVYFTLYWLYDFVFAKYKFE